MGIVAVAITVLPAVTATAFERFDFDQRYFIDPGFIVKDHSVVQAAGDTFHLFYIKADETVPEGQRAKALGHATSIDLKHWTFHPDVIPVVPNTWEESFIWAPHVVQANGVYYMYYTGVNRFFAQATGLAVSLDLYNWFKSPLNPVYTPDPAWAKWDSVSWSNCRDPFVFQDNGVWHLLTTAQTSDFKGAISHATSTNLVQWQDQGPLFVHPGPNAWHVLESANLHHVNGTWTLTFTEQNVGGSSFLQAADLLGPWDYAKREPFDAGHATELFQIQGQWMLTRHTTFAFDGLPRYVIKFDNVLWGSTGRPIIDWSDPLEGWTVWSGDAFYLQPAFWDNAWVRSGQSAQFAGNSWIGTAEAFTGPLQVGFPGLAVGDAPTGILRSKTWTLAGNRIDFLVGGDADPARLYLALVTADDGAQQRVATGNGTEAMTPGSWSVSSLVGRPVYLEIADLATDGHLNVDEIVVSWDDAPTDAAGTLPMRVRLYANVPNPFNPSTRIGFDLPRAARARLAIFDVRGRRLRTLAAGPHGAGHHEVVWDGRSETGRRVASGVYYYRLVVDAQPVARRAMLLLK